MEQRIIKFRVWDEKNIHQLEQIDLKYISQSENEALMQFTGFHDIKGKEVWEGDIVRNSSNVVWWIIWDETMGRWAYSRGGIMEQPFGRTGFGLTYNSSKKLEIIGNIHENPNLLSSESNQIK